VDTVRNEEDLTLIAELNDTALKRLRTRREKTCGTIKRTTKPQVINVKRLRRKNTCARKSGETNTKGLLREMKRKTGQQEPAEGKSA